MPRLTRLFAQTLVILGLAPVAYAIGLFAWQVYTWAITGAWVPLPGHLLVDPTALQAARLAAVAPFIPSIDWPWVNDPKIAILFARVIGVILYYLHVGVFAGLAGWGLIAFGRSIAARQSELIEWQERQRADRLRRAAQYRA